MATFALIHGGGDVGWYWHLVEAEVRERGHEVVAPDLPCEDSSADLDDYADTVVAAIGDRDDLIVVGQSYGGFTAPLVAAARALGTSWKSWTNGSSLPGHREAVEDQARRDGGLTRGHRVL